MERKKQKKMPSDGYANGAKRFEFEKCVASHVNPEKCIMNQMYGSSKTRAEAEKSCKVSRSDAQELCRAMQATQAQFWGSKKK